MFSVDYKIVFLFSGQGSQYRNMGKELYLNHPIFKRSIQKSDLIFQKHLQRSLIEELYYNNNLIFDELLITHPAIVAIEVAMIEVMDSCNIYPDYVLGQSLGEFAAGVASKVWSSDSAIKAAIEQAKSLVRSGITGGMMSVINSESHRNLEIYKRYNLYLGMDNFRGHFTVSGELSDLKCYEEILKEEKISYSHLPVRVPFHSPLIEKGLNDFLYSIPNEVMLTKPNIPYLSNISNDFLSQVDYEYYNQVTSTYSNYSKSIHLLEERGPCLYIDLGPSGTNATFVKYTITKDSLSCTQSIISHFGNELENLKKLQSQIYNFSDCAL